MAGRPEVPGARSGSPTSRTRGTRSWSACTASASRTRSDSATRGTRRSRAERPAVLEVVVDPEMPPLPPHITREQAEEAGEGDGQGRPRGRRRDGEVAAGEGRRAAAGAVMIERRGRPQRPCGRGSRPSVRRRGALRRGRPRALRHRRLELPAGADRRRHPADGRRRRRDGGGLPRARRADPLARRRHEPRRPVLQRRRGHRLLEVPEPHRRRSTRSASSARVAARASSSTTCATRPSALRPDLRARPVDAQPLHPRRDDRQQLLRRRTRSWRSSTARAATSDNVHELEVLTYDGDRLTVGETSDAELARIIASGGRRARSTASCATCATATRDLDPRALPATSRAASPATTSTSCCPRTASTSRGALVGTEGTCVTILEATVQPDRQPAGAQRSSCSATPTSARAGDHVPERARAPGRSGSRASTTCWSRT